MMHRAITVTLSLVLVSSVYADQACEDFLASKLEELNNIKHCYNDNTTPDDLLARATSHVSGTFKSNPGLFCEATCASLFTEAFSSLLDFEAQSGAICSDILIAQDGLTDTETGTDTSSTVSFTTEEQLQLLTAGCSTSGDGEYCMILMGQVLASSQGGAPSCDAFSNIGCCAGTFINCLAFVEDLDANDVCLSVAISCGDIDWEQNCDDLTCGFVCEDNDAYNCVNKIAENTGGHCTAAEAFSAMRNGDSIFEENPADVCDDCVSNLVPGLLSLDFDGEDEKCKVLFTDADQCGSQNDCEQNYACVDGVCLRACENGCDQGSTTQCSANGFCEQDPSLGRSSFATALALLCTKDSETTYCLQTLKSAGDKKNAKSAISAVRDTMRKLAKIDQSVCAEGEVAGLLELGCCLNILTDCGLDLAFAKMDLDTVCSIQAVCTEHAWEDYCDFPGTCQRTCTDSNDVFACTSAFTNGMGNECSFDDVDTIETALYTLSSNQDVCQNACLDEYVTALNAVDDLSAECTTILGETCQTDDDCPSNVLTCVTSGDAPTDDASFRDVFGRDCAFWANNDCDFTEFSEYQYHSQLAIEAACAATCGTENGLCLQKCEADVECHGDGSCVQGHCEFPSIFKTTANTLNLVCTRVACAGAFIGADESSACKQSFLQGLPTFTVDDPSTFCASHSDCAPAAAAATKTLEQECMVLFSEKPCIVAADCKGANQVCIHNSCHASCNVDDTTNCATGEICLDGACQLLQPNTITTMSYFVTAACSKNADSQFCAPKLQTMFTCEAFQASGCCAQTAVQCFPFVYEQVSVPEGCVFPTGNTCGDIVCAVDPTVSSTQSPSTSASLSPSTSVSPSTTPSTSVSTSVSPTPAPVFTNGATVSFDFKLKGVTCDQLSQTLTDTIRQFFAEKLEVSVSQIKAAETACAAAAAGKSNGLVGAFLSLFNKATDPNYAITATVSSSSAAATLSSQLTTLTSDPTALVSSLNSAIATAGLGLTVTGVEVSNPTVEQQGTSGTSPIAVSLVAIFAALFAAFLG